MKTWKKLVSCLLVLSMIASMFVVVTAEEADQPEASDDPISYDNCVDANGNPLNPYIINNDVWVEENGGLKMPANKLFSFLLFDTPLETNRVEATFENMSLSGSGDDRNGIVFALTDHNPGAALAGEGDANVSYYWACITGWGGEYRVEVLKMGKYNGWEMISAGGWATCGKTFTELGIENSGESVTLAAEWDNEGHIKVFANGTLVEEITDTTGTPLTGNLYGIVTRRYANRPGSENPATYTDTLTSFVTGDVKLTVNATAGEGGTVTEGGEFYRGQSATVTATPDEGYNFVGWYVGEELVSADATYTFKVTGNRDLVAVFTSTTYAVTVAPAENGTAVGGGVVAEGSNVTVTATPDTGYKFVGWYNESDELVSEDATYTFTVTASCTLTAKFEKVEYSIATDAEGNLLNPYYVNGVTWVEENGGIKMPAGHANSFLLFDNTLANNRVEATIVINDNIGGDPEHRNGIVFALTDIEGDAANSSGYWGTDFSYYWAFVDDWNCLHLWEMSAAQQWADLAPYVDLSSIGIDVTAGVTIAAEWDANGNIKVFANGILAIETVDETPLTGNLYGLLVNKWGNTQGADYAYPYNAPVTSFVAGGALATPDMNVDVTVDPTEGGIVTGTGNHYLGATATLVATPNEGYTFVGWYENGELVSADATYSFRVTGNCNLTAVFTNITYTVTVTPDENVEFTGEGSYAEGTDATVTVTPKLGYKFVGWYNGETEVSTDVTYTFTVTADIELTAKFEKVEYTIPVDAQGNKLTTYVVNGVVWVEEDGSLKMPAGNLYSFLLFNDELANNRVEITIHPNDLHGSGDDRNGIVFALTDYDNDAAFGIDTTDASYYWAYISGWEGRIQVLKMSKDSKWTSWINEGGAGGGKPLADLGIDLTDGVTLAVEWNDEGCIKVYADGILVYDIVDTDPLTGDFYGMLARKWGNFEGPETAYPYDAPVTSFVAGGELVWFVPEVPEPPTAPESYENCTDAEGNLLNPVFVNDIYWELGDGELKMPFGTDHSFLLFDTPLANNRVEATIAIRDTGIWGDVNRRNGIVFALSDNAGDGSFLLWDTDISYYWAFVDDWNCLHIFEMSAAQQWADLTTIVDLPSLGIDVTQGITIAAEWDAEGHIKIYANDILAMDFVDETPLTGNLYGLLVNNYGNFDAAYGPCDGPVTSFVAGGELVWAEPEVPVVPEISLDVTVPEDGIVAGDEVVVDIVIKNNPGIAGLVITLKYDDSVLTLKEAVNGTLFSGFDSALNIAWDETFNVTEDGVLATLTFVVAEGAEAGDYTIEVLVRECINVEFEDLEATGVNGTITVTEAAEEEIMYGDVNGDGEVNAKDAAKLKKYVANFDEETGTSTETVEAGADVNGDGEINAKDAAKLKKYVANYDEETGTSTEVLGPQ